MVSAGRESGGAPGEQEQSDAARKRVAVEMVAQHEGTLRRTARRYSICAEDADDAYQRALEILLTKAPPGEARELIRWMQTVTKHEALAVRRSRERQIGSRPPAAWEDESGDWLDLLPSAGVGPAERAERREAIARSREALKTLKPAELRALTLLAEGYSYTEIGEITGYSRTKINRCLAEGRERFRAFVSRSESGDRCAELRPLLSAFCDGEASPAEVATLREHLRACAHCRAAMRAYRAAPSAAAVLAPAPFALRSLLERAQEVVAGLQSRLPGRAGGREATALQATAAGGAKGAGMTGLAKVLAICAGTAGGAAACIAGGVIPGPSGLAPDRAVEAQIERVSAAAHVGAAPKSQGSTLRAGRSSRSMADSGPAGGDPEPVPSPPTSPEPVAVEPEPALVEAEPVESEPPVPAPAPEPVSAPSTSSAPAESTASPAGEFGPSRTGEPSGDFSSL